MIDVSENFEANATAKRRERYNLMRFEFPITDNIYLTNCPNNITVDGRTYVRNTGTVIALGIPRTTSSINRSLHTIALWDDIKTFEWTNRIKQNERFTFHMYVIFRDLINGGYTESLKLYSGQSSAIGYSSGDGVYTITVQLVGAFLQQDGTYGAMTAAQHQKERDSSDTFFDYAGIPRELSWNKQPI